MENLQTNNSKYFASDGLPLFLGDPHAKPDPIFPEYPWSIFLSAIALIAGKYDHLSPDPEEYQVCQFLECADLLEPELLEENFLRWIIISENWGPAPKEAWAALINQLRPPTRIGEFKIQAPPAHPGPSHKKTNHRVTPGNDISQAPMDQDEYIKKEFEKPFEKARRSYDAFYSNKPDHPVKPRRQISLKRPTETNSSKKDFHDIHGGLGGVFQNIQKKFESQEVPDWVTEGVTTKQGTSKRAKWLAQSPETFFDRKYPKWDFARLYRLVKTNNYHDSGVKQYWVLKLAQKEFARQAKVSLWTVAHFFSISKHHGICLKIYKEVPPWDDLKTKTGKRDGLCASWIFAKTMNQSQRFLRSWRSVRPHLKKRLSSLRQAKT